jgi:hypothetical protein
VSSYKLEKNEDDRHLRCASNVRHVPVVLGLFQWDVTWSANAQYQRGINKAKTYLPHQDHLSFYPQHRHS